MGKKKFSWQLASAEEIAEKIVKEGTQGLRTQLAHYRETSCQVMLEKIERAKKLAELILLERQVVSKRQEIEAL